MGVLFTCGIMGIFNLHASMSKISDIEASVPSLTVGVLPDPPTGSVRYGW